jgi:hypothetical protein
VWRFIVKGYAGLTPIRAAAHFNVSFKMDHLKTLDTSLGQIHFSAQAEPTSGGVYEVEFRVVELEPSLPPGMSVRRVRAILLLACSHTGFERLDYGCRFVTGIEGGPESGEHLDAQSWEGEHDVVVVGTEDGEALSGRMPWLHIQGDPLALVQYRDDGLNVPLKRIPAGVTIGLHYVVAENDNPEPLECSAWYAVDVPHEQLLKIGS